MAAGEFVLERTQVLPRPRDEVFAFFSDPLNLEAITPAWLGFHVTSAPERLGRHSFLRYRLCLRGVGFGWLTEIVEWSPPGGFKDVQRTGPYPLWEHTHRFAAVPGGTEVYDHVRYRVPGGPLAPLVQRLAVGPWLDRIFDYRRERLAELLGGSDVANDVSSV